MLNNSTIKFLRIPFPFFLSPVYLFALAQVRVIIWLNAILIFIILHFLIYPASNGYNSYMDPDTESIGGLEKPPPPTKQLYSPLSGNKSISKKANRFLLEFPEGKLNIK